MPGSHHSVKRDGTANPDIEIRKDGTVVYREEIMGKVGKDYGGRWWFSPQGSYSTPTRRFETRRAAINALILKSALYPEFPAAGVDTQEPTS